MSKDNITALMGEGTEYQGQLNFKGAVRINGKFLGSITSEGKLVLGKDAYVEGTIHVGELEVQGTLKGDITVTNRTLLHNTARVAGSLGTALLVMEEGALLQGELRMGKDVKEAVIKADSGIVKSDHSVQLADAPIKQ
jgi:cytoskeletal protein CcmA (bactofilin family)